MYKELKIIENFLKSNRKSLILKTDVNHQKIIKDLKLNNIYNFPYNPSGLYRDKKITIITNPNQKVYELIIFKN